MLQQKKIIILLVLINIINSKGQVHLSLSNSLLHKNKKDQTQTYSVSYGQESIIFKYPHASSTISIELINTDGQTDKICSPLQRDIVFADYENGLEVPLMDYKKQIGFENSDSQQSDVNYNDPSYFLSSPILVNMIHVPEGFAVVSTDHQLLLLKVTNNQNQQSGYEVKVVKTIDFSDLRIQQLDYEVPQILYDPISQNLFIIYKSQILGGRLDILLYDSSDNQQNSTLRDLKVDGKIMDNSQQFIGIVKIAKGHLFVPLGAKGMDIYKVTMDGELQYISNIYEFSEYTSKHYIVDVAIGGNQTQHMYVLDRLNGVTAFDISNITEIIQNFDLGFISVKGGLLLKEWNSTNIFVLCEGDISSQVMEYGINMNTNEWFQLRRHYLFGHYFDLEVTQKFAILRGVDAHRIIYHSIWEGFQRTYSDQQEENAHMEAMTKLDEEYLFLPALEQLEFFSPQYGFGDPTSWQFNQTHQFLVGLTTHSIVQLPYFFMSPYIQCYPNDRSMIGDTLNYELIVNTTDCQQKQYDVMILIIQQNKRIKVKKYMHKCASTQKLWNTYYFTSEQLFSIIIGLSFLLLMLSIGLAMCYSKFLLRKIAISNQIQEFETQGYNSESIYSDVGL